MSKALGLWVSLVALSPLVAQDRALSVREVKQILLSGGDVIGWGEFTIPEFLASAYGLRARDALIAILVEPSTPENEYVQIQALTAARYTRVAIPTSYLLAYAVGDKRSNFGVMRHRAVTSLTWRPDSSLVGFWREIASEPDPSFRQVAAGGLACVLGSAAVPHLEHLARDVDAVARVARFHLLELASKGDSALSCGGGLHTRRGALNTPPAPRAELMKRGAEILREIP